MYKKSTKHVALVTSVHYLKHDVIAAAILVEPYVCTMTLILLAY